MCCEQWLRLCPHNSNTTGHQTGPEGVNPATDMLNDLELAALFCFMQREDGTNVNQWHWKEKDCMKWTKARLGELFSSLSLVQGPATVSTTGLESVTGGPRAGLVCAALLRHSSSCTNSKGNLSH